MQVDGYMSLLPLWRFLLNGFRAFMAHKGLETAKSLTYTSLFAVVPLLTLTLAILSAFPSFQVFSTQVQAMLFDRLLPSSSTELQDYLAGFAGQATQLTWVGAVMLLATAYLMLVSIEEHFNSIWGVSKHRQGLASFLLYWCVLSLGPLLLGLGFAISSYLTSLSLFQRVTEVTDQIGANALMLRLFPSLMTVGAFTLLYAAVPNCPVRVRHALAGAVLVAITLVLLKWLFGVFITTASYQVVYGTFAALPIFLLWLYVCWVVILCGANLVHALPNWQHQHEQKEVHPTLLLFALLHLFWRRQQQGEGVQISRLQEQGWNFAGTPVEELLNLLSENKLIRNVDHDEYVLVRDLHGVTMWQLLRACPWSPPSLQELQQPLPAVLRLHLPVLSGFQQKIGKLEQTAYQQFQTTVGDEFARLQAATKS